MDAAIWLMLILVCLSGLGYLRGISLLLAADRDPDVVRWQREAEEAREELEIEELERMARLK